MRSSMDLKVCCNLIQLCLLTKDIGCVGWLYHLNNLELFKKILFHKKARAALCSSLGITLKNYSFEQSAGS